MTISNNKNINIVTYYPVTSLVYFSIFKGGLIPSYNNIHTIPSIPTFPSLPKLPDKPLDIYSIWTPNYSTDSTVTIRDTKFRVNAATNRFIIDSNLSMDAQQHAATPPQYLEIDPWIPSNDFKIEMEFNILKIGSNNVSSIFGELLVPKRFYLSVNKEEEGFTYRLGASDFSFKIGSMPASLGYQKISIDVKDNILTFSRLDLDNILETTVKVSNDYFLPIRIFGKYDDSTRLDGQIYDIKLIDRTNSTNVRFYKSKIFLEKMPTTNIVDNTSNQIPKLDGVLNNLNTLQPWVPLRYNDEHFCGNITNTLWTKGISFTKTVDTNIVALSNSSGNTGILGSFDSKFITKGATIVSKTNTILIVDSVEIDSSINTTIIYCTKNGNSDLLIQKSFEYPNVFKIKSVYTRTSNKWLYNFDGTSYGIIPKFSSNNWTIKGLFLTTVKTEIDWTYLLDTRSANELKGIRLVFAKSTNRLVFHNDFTKDIISDYNFIQKKNVDFYSGYLIPFEANSGDFNIPAAALISDITLGARYPIEFQQIDLQLSNLEFIDHDDESNSREYPLSQVVEVTSEELLTNPNMDTFDGWTISPNGTEDRWTIFVDGISYIYGDNTYSDLYQFIPATTEVTYYFVDITLISGEAQTWTSVSSVDPVNTSSRIFLRGRQQIILKVPKGTVKFGISRLTAVKDKIEFIIHSTSVKYSIEPENTGIPILVQSDKSFPTTYDDFLARYDFTDKSFTKTVMSPKQDWADLFWRFDIRRYVGHTLRLKVEANILFPSSRGIHFLVRQIDITNSKYTDHCYKIAYEVGLFKNECDFTILPNSQINSSINFQIFYENMNEIPLNTKMFDNLKFTLEDITNNRIIDKKCSNKDVKYIEDDVWEVDQFNPDKLHIPSTQWVSTRISLSTVMNKTIKIRIFVQTNDNIGVGLYHKADINGNTWLGNGYNELIIHMTRDTLVLNTQSVDGYVIVNEVSIYSHGTMYNLNPNQSWVPYRDHLNHYNSNLTYAGWDKGMSVIDDEVHMTSTIEPNGKLGSYYGIADTLLNTVLVAKNGSMIKVFTISDSDVNSMLICKIVHGTDEELRSGFEYPNTFVVYQDYPQYR